jgi:hypothetical protein
MNKRKIITNILSVLTLGVAFFAWLSVRSAIIVPESSTWEVPMFLFSVYFVLICLDIILIRDLLLLELVLIGSLLLSLVFAFAWLQLIAALVSAYLLFLASRKIRRDMELNIKVSTWKSLQTGKTFLLVSIGLLITMQYFLTIRSFDGEKKVPNFDASFITKKIAIPFISSINPQFKALKDETLTVDQFILQTQATNKSEEGFSSVEEEMLNAQLPANLTPSQIEIIKNQVKKNFANSQSEITQKNQELVLLIGRKQFSDMIGRSVDGNEKISEVFTGLINNKINEYFNPKMGGAERNSVFPIILALVLLLTIYPVGLVLFILVFLMVFIIIEALIKLEVLNIATIPVLKEVLE